MKQHICNLAPPFPVFSNILTFVARYTQDKMIQIIKETLKRISFFPSRSAVLTESVLMADNSAGSSLMLRFSLFPCVYVHVFLRSCVHAFLCSCVLLLSPPLYAQQDFTLHNMNTIPQYTYTNPAYFPFAKVNIGLPVISSVYAGVSHSGFTFSDMFHVRADDSIDVDMDRVLKKLAKRNHLSLAVQADLFSLGFRVKDNNYFSMNVTEKAFLRLTYPRDMIKLFWKGNGAFLDDSDGIVSFRGIGFDAIHYREYALCWAHRFPDKKYSVGGKLKYLYGMENIWTKTSDITLQTDTETYDWTFRSNWLVNSSLAVTDSNFDMTPANYLFKLKNRGLGIDAGGTYDITDDISVSASLIDFGYIRWKEYPKNYANDSAKFTYQGLDVTQFFKSLQSDTVDLFQPIIDSLNGTFKIKETAKPYTNWLTPQIYLTGIYRMDEKNNFTGTIWMEKFKKHFYPGLSLAANTRVGKWLGASLSYSVYNRSFLNFGAGLSLNLAFFQFYIVTDNFYGAFYPDKARNAHVHFGLNLTFGRGRKDTDKDGVYDNKDECPDIKGLKEFSGCPDSDNDKVIDKFDECPAIPGIIALKGCPDRDGDKIADKDDKCPDVPGPRDNKGCPMKLHLLGAKNDTLQSVMQGEDGYFIFDKLPMDPQQKFGLEKFDDNLTIPEVFIVANGDVIPLQRSEDGFYRYKTLPQSGVKLYMIDAKGDTLETADMTKDSMFIFSKLPDHPNYFFALVGIDEPQVTIIANGSVMTAKKFSENHFRFEKLPEQEQKLYLISPAGDTLMVATRNEDGFFVFEKLPPDENVMFVLSGGDTTSVRELKVLFKGENMRKIIKGADSFFRYEKLPSDEMLNLSLLEEKDVKAKLKPEEKTILNTAFSNLEFDVGMDVIRSESNKALDELAALLISKQSWKLKLGGHTDNIGGENFNVVLSKRRVEAVKRYLVERGVGADRILLRYFGMKYPIADNNSPAGRQKNRRVEMLVLQTGEGQLYGEGGGAEKGIIFKVQITTSKKLKALKPENFNGVEDVGYYEDGGVYKYTVGNTGDYNAALALQNKMKEKGFKEAFVVAFNNGKRIAVTEALEMLKK